MSELRWRDVDEELPEPGRSVVFVDEDGELDIGEYRRECREIRHPHFHYRRGICAEAMVWCYALEVKAL